MKVAILLMSAVIAAGPAIAADAPTENPLVGAYHLIQIDEPGPDGKIVPRTDLTGSLIYTPTGRMSVQVLYPDATVSNDYAKGGYEADCVEKLPIRIACETIIFNDCRKDHLWESELRFWPVFYFVRSPIAISGYSVRVFQHNQASFGRYTVDARAHRVTHHVEGANARTLIGADLPRSYRLSGRRLIISSTRPDEHWAVTWERF